MNYMSVTKFDIKKKQGVQLCNDSDQQIIMSCGVKHMMVHNFYMIRLLIYVHEKKDHLNGREK